MGILTILLYLIFVLSCFFLIGIVLLQEGKGGGFGEAFGGMVSDTFGVRASGVTKVTAALAGIFVVSAILISMFYGTGSSGASPGATGTTESTTLEPEDFGATDGSATEGSTTDEDAAGEGSDEDAAAGDGDGDAAEADGSGDEGGDEGGGEGR